MLHRLSVRAVGLTTALLAAMLMFAGAPELAVAEDPEQQVRARIEAAANEDGTTSLAFQQFIDGEWVTTPIDQWNATVPSLGVEDPIWTSDPFDLTVTVPAPEFGLPPSTLEPPEMPDDWERPKEKRGTLWGFRYSYDPEDGFASVWKDMKLVDGVSPSSNTQNIVRFNMGCSGSTSFVVFITDIPPTEDGFEVLWWVDGNSPRAGQWSGDDVQDNEFFATRSPNAASMIEELREGTNLYVTIWGDDSWRSARLHVTNLFKTHAQEPIDYCGQEPEIPEGSIS